MDTKIIYVGTNEFCEPQDEQKAIENIKKMLEDLKDKGYNVSEYVYTLNGKRINL